MRAHVFLCMLAYYVEWHMQQRLKPMLFDDEQRTLPKDLGTLAYNITHTHISPGNKIVLITRPTPIQSKAFSLLDLNPACTQ